MLTFLYDSLKLF